MIIIKFGFIGSGKVGISLGRYLKEKGEDLSGYYSKSDKSSFEGAKFTDSKQFINLENLIKKSDIIFITTSDGEISNVYNDLKKYCLKNKILCHCSGSLSKNIFEDLNNRGGYGYSIHPLFPINHKFNSYKNLKDAFITIEGDLEYLEYFKDLFLSFGNKVKCIKSEDKVKYHLGAVFCSNLVIPLINDGVKYLKFCGFTQKEALEALAPLIICNIKNVLESGITNSITGPVERCDTEIIKKHLDVICVGNDRDIYEKLSLEIIKIAKGKSLKDYSEMERVLNEKE